MTGDTGAGPATAASPSAGVPLPDIALIETFWRRFVRPGDVHEVRITDSRRGPAKLWKTCAGYFRGGDPGFVREVGRLSGRDAQAIYITLNPVKENLLARASGRIATDVKSTSADADIVRRAHFFVDTDPRREAGISATNEERDRALAVRDAIRDWLEDLGWPDPLYIAMSGNGGSLVYCIDLPNDDAATALIEQCLKALAANFETGHVAIDQSVSNAARLTKVIGTVAAKGDHVPELGRVWRVSQAEFCLDAATISRAQLEALAALAPSGRQSGPTIFTDVPSRDGRDWTIAAVLRRKGIGFLQKVRTYGTAYVLDTCLTSTAHSDGAAILERHDGALGYRCHHNSCRGRGWHDARAALGLAEPAAAGDTDSPNATSAGAESARNRRDEADPGAWVAPDPIFGPPPAPALPIALFPKEIADVALDVAERQQAPIDFVAWPLVGASAGLIGRGAAIRPRAFDDWTERPCLWIACIAPPSWMKSPAILEGIRPLRRQQEFDHQEHMAAMQVWEQECADLKAENPKLRPSDLPPAPVEQRCLVADATVEKLAMLMQHENQRGLTLHRDELAGLILGMNKYRQKGGDLQFYLQAYTGGPYSVDRVTRESIFIPDLLLNVIGGIQPEVARSVFGTGPNDGFAARFTSIWPDLDPNYRTVDRWPNRHARAALDGVNDRLVGACWEQSLQLDDYQPTPFCRLEPAGQQWFSEWHEQLMTPCELGPTVIRATPRASASTRGWRPASSWSSICSSGRRDARRRPGRYRARRSRGCWTSWTTTSSQWSGGSTPPTL